MQFRKIKGFLKNQYVSGLIVGAIVLVLTNVIPLIRSFVSNQSFKESFSKFWNYKVELWLILVVLFGMAILIIALNLIRKEKKFRYDHDSLELDRKLFDKIRNDYLNQSGTIYWLRTQHFGGSFSDKISDPLFKIQEESFQSDFEFLNPKLEQLKKVLIEEIKDFNSIIVNQTFRHGPNSQAVPSEWVHKQPERYENVVNQLNDLADRICEKYDSFIRYGRRTLKS
ncbi:hypothetical protein KXJ69_01085 [Aureisphaera sp. CAU 1614]|uniref:Uncharacterized protein n=1 Tax=Halomarinibacterium sedimenti TaxID=2857106 RepID=A0A9X1JW55_9FLAO|nr:hypothetical protein [Halomarinibacterium sedimenti]MBW2936678.1 hypothetical protein [Halomarinibacterium sedimenti]